jgi:hypothetical protein
MINIIKLFMFFVCIILTWLSPNLAPIIIIYIYIKLRKYVTPNTPFNVTDTYILLVCGYFSCGILATNLIQDRAFFSGNTTSYVYSTFVCVSVITAALFWNINSSTKNEYEMENQNHLIFFMSLLPIIVSIKVFYLGYSSGYEFASSGWRKSIIDNMSGIEWLLFKSWILVAALCAFNFNKSNKKDKFLFLLCMFSLSLYGGRFLIFAALVIAALAYFSVNKFYIKQLGWRPLVLIISLFFTAVLSGVYRYTNSEGIEFNMLSFIAGFHRQLTGPVYDFDMSHQFVDSFTIYSLIINKIQVSIAPFIYTLEGSQTIGGYLAEQAGRAFEHGHRISAPGESYYIGGYFMVIITSILLTVLVVISNNLYQKSIEYKLTATVIFFNVLFCIFIDFSHIFTTIYMLIYLYGIIVLISILRQASR